MLWIDSYRFGAPGMPDIGFVHLWWAEGPEFQALGLADSDPVSTWPDEVGTADAVQATGSLQPVYRTGPSEMNSKPAVFFNSDRIVAAAGGASTSVFSFVAVVYYPNTTTAGYIYDQQGASRTTMGTDFGGTAWQIYAGSSVTGGTRASGRHLFVGVFRTSGNEELDIDGTNVLTGAAGSANSATSVLIGGDATMLQNAYVELLGVVNADVRTHGNWSAWKSWIADRYNITIA